MRAGAPALPIPSAGGPGAGRAAAAALRGAPPVPAAALPGARAGGHGPAAGVVHPCCATLAEHARRADPQASFRGAANEWGTLVLFGLDPARRPLFRAALHQAREALRHDPAGIQLNPLHALYLVEVESDPAAALGTAIEATLVDPWGGLLVEHLERHRAIVTRQAFAQAIDALPLAAAQRERLWGLWQRAASGGGADTVLERHVQRIVQLCRDAGAQPVLLDYPMAIPEVAGLLARISATLGVPLVDIGVEFARLARDEPERELYCGDGARHCNTAGYGVMARIVAADALARLR